MADDHPDTWLLDLADPIIAPDGSTVRPLGEVAGLGSMAHFELVPGGVSTAVRHLTVHEIWYVISGFGEMWRQAPERETVVPLAAGTAVGIRCGTAFQFRADATGPLRIVAVTLPPWPTDRPEALPVPGRWVADPAGQSAGRSAGRTSPAS